MSTNSTKNSSIIARLRKAFARRQHSLEEQERMASTRNALVRCGLLSLY